MDVLRHWLIVLLGFGGLELIKQLCQRLSLPRFPWRIASLALLAWGWSIRSIGVEPIPFYALALPLPTTFFLALATRAAIWLFLEVLLPLPADWAVPKIIRDLLFVDQRLAGGDQPATTRPN